MSDNWSGPDPAPGATGRLPPSFDRYGVAGNAPGRPSSAVRPGAWPGAQEDGSTQPAGVERLGPAEPWPPRNGAAAGTAPGSAPKLPSYAPKLPSRGAERPDREGEAQMPVDAAPPGVAPLGRDESAPAETVPADAVPCEGAQIVGRVGPHAILASDVWIAADAILAQNRAKIPPGHVEEQREILIKQSFRPLLKKEVETKLIYYDAINALPKQAIENVEEQVNRIFEEGELPKLMELWGVHSQRELDEKLIDLGTSVHRQKRAFLEQMIAQQWMRQKIKIDEDVNHEQMLEYYDQHVSDFEQPARTRWEQLSVRIARYPSKEAARAALAAMGNQVLDGRPLADVAKEQSDGPTASQGGIYPWTGRGSLVSKMLDEAIFGLPVGRLSPILEDGRWLHIVRVTQREDARRTPFVHAQGEIRKKIRQQRNQVQQQAYLDGLRRRVPVWTLYGEEQEASGFLNPRR